MIDQKEHKEKRFEIEKELVGYDKQKLISEVLKVYDVNVRLADELSTAHSAGVAAMEKVAAARNEVERLKDRTLWQIINERLERRIEKIRTRQNRTFI